MSPGGGVRRNRVGLTLVIVAFVAVLLVLPAPVAASNRYFARFVAQYAVNLFDDVNCGGATPYPANTPIFVVDGYNFPMRTFTAPLKAAAMGPNSYFQLSIDGVVQHTQMLGKYIPAYDVQVKLFTAEYDYGFPAGSYEFVGNWYVDGLLADPPGTSGQPVLILTCVTTFTFS